MPLVVGSRVRSRRIRRLLRPGVQKCYLDDMTTIPQKELRNQVGDVLRRVEAGEHMIVTVAGRPVAELTPIYRRRWVSGLALDQVWGGAAPQGLSADLEALDGVGVIDPFTP